MLRRGLAVTAALCLMATGGSACTATHQAQGPKATANAPAPFSRSTDPVFALVSQTGDFAATEQLLLSAEQRIRAECVRAKGFRYIEEPAALLTQNHDAGLPDVSRRQRVGYGLYDSVTSKGNAGVAPQNDAYVRSLPASQQTTYLQVLFGNERKDLTLPDGTSVSYPTTGCVAEARARLYGSSVVWAEVSHIPQSLNSRLSRDLLKSPEYSRALDGWSLCMRRAGFTVQTPGDAEQQLASAYAHSGATSELHRREIATAVADAKCALALRLTDEALTIKYSLFKDLPASATQQLPSLLALRNVAIQRAHRDAG